ncbi:MAG: hypothetical protein HY335_04805 [Deinococcus sp.]|nr:hypothetical protein [Deinococcus sp.]
MKTLLMLLLLLIAWATPALAFEGRATLVAERVITFLGLPIFSAGTERVPVAFQGDRWRRGAVGQSGFIYDGHSGLLLSLRSRDQVATQEQVPPESLLFRLDGIDPSIAQRLDALGARLEGAETLDGVETFIYGFQEHPGEGTGAILITNRASLAPSLDDLPLQMVRTGPLPFLGGLVGFRLTTRLEGVHSEPIPAEELRLPPGYHFVTGVPVDSVAFRARRDTGFQQELAGQYVQAVRILGFELPDLPGSIYIAGDKVRIDEGFPASGRSTIWDLSEHLTAVQDRSTNVVTREEVVDLPDDLLPGRLVTRDFLLGIGGVLVRTGEKDGLATEVYRLPLDSLPLPVEITYVPELELILRIEFSLISIIQASLVTEIRGLHQERVEDSRFALGEGTVIMREFSPGSAAYAQSPFTPKP